MPEYNYSESLNAEKAWIWRIVHRDNLPWVLDNGLHAANGVHCPGWVSIGNAELTDRRGEHVVPIAPGGVLNDYVPFYFTPFSPMLLNIATGRNGVTRRDMSEILILVSSLKAVHRSGRPFVFTDAHAYYRYARYYSSLSDLEKVDWALLQKRDFRRDDDDPGRLERYQAEALVYQHLPVSLLAGVICHNDEVMHQVRKHLDKAGVVLPVHARPRWYF